MIRTIRRYALAFAASGLLLLPALAMAEHKPADPSRYVTERVSVTGAVLSVFPASETRAPNHRPPTLIATVSTARSAMTIVVRMRKPVDRRGDSSTSVEL